MSPLSTEDSKRQPTLVENPSVRWLRPRALPRDMDYLHGGEAPIVARPAAAEQPEPAPGADVPLNYPNFRGPRRISAAIRPSVDFRTLGRRCSADRVYSSTCKHSWAQVASVQLAQALLYALRTERAVDVGRVGRASMEKSASRANGVTECRHLSTIFVTHPPSAGLQATVEHQRYGSADLQHILDTERTVPGRNAICQRLVHVSQRPMRVVGRGTISTLDQFAVSKFLPPGGRGRMGKNAQMTPTWLFPKTRGEELMSTCHRYANAHARGRWRMTVVPCEKARHCALRGGEHPGVTRTEFPSITHESAGLESSRSMSSRTVAGGGPQQTAGRRDVSVHVPERTRVPNRQGNDRRLTFCWGRSGWTRGPAAPGNARGGREGARPPPAQGATAIGKGKVHTVAGRMIILGEGSCMYPW